MAWKLAKRPEYANREALQILVATEAKKQGSADPRFAESLRLFFEQEKAAGTLYAVGATLVLRRQRDEVMGFRCVL
jgi:hypothetical protein